MRLSLALLFAFVLIAAAAPDGSSEFMQGLQALQHAKFDDATAALNKAVDADEENPDYRVARAVSLIFSGKIKESRADLERAQKLRPHFDSARLWLATAVAMQGNFQEDSDIYPYAQFQRPYENAVRTMSHDYGQWFWEIQENARTNFPPPNPNSTTGRKFAAAKAKFPELANQFVADLQSRLSQADPKWADFFKSHALDEAKNSPPSSGSMSDLARELSAHPKDPVLLEAHAAGALKAGAPGLARLEATRAISRDPGAVEAYLTRAVAAATIGDQRRAQADLAIAAALRPGSDQAARAAVTAAAQQAPRPARLKNLAPL